MNANIKNTLRQRPTISRETTSIIALLALALASCGGSGSTSAPATPTPSATAPSLSNATALELVAGQELSAPATFTNTGGAATACRVDSSGQNPALPDDLQLSLTSGSTPSCQITGTPRAAIEGTLTVRVIATNAGGSSPPATIALSISNPSPPAITAPTTPGATPPQFVAGTDNPPVVLPNTGGAVSSCRVDTSGGKPDLPNGLRLELATTGSTRTCQIVGTPTQTVSAMTVEVTIIASNPASTSSVAVTIMLEPEPALKQPQLDDISTAQSFTVNVEIPPIVFTNSGGSVDANGCQLDPSSPALPTGLTVEPADDSGTMTCQITGTPTEPVTPARTVTITATNAANTGSPDTATVSIEVSPPAPQPPSLADVAQPQSFTVNVEITPIVFTNSGGDVASSGCALDPSSPALPTGLTVEPADDSGTMTCRITGTPTELVSPARTITVASTNAANTGSPDTATVSIEVSPPALQPPSLADAAQPQSFTVNVEITPIVFTNSGGDVAAAGCSLDPSSPALPTGLTVEPADDSGTMTCQITGTPSELVTPARTITVAATNAANTGSPDTATVSIEVSPPALQPPSLADVAQPQSFTVNVEITPIVFTNSGGDVAAAGCSLDSSSPALPAGLAVEPADDSGTMTCQITGTPTEPVTPARTVTITATNAANTGSPDTATVSIEVSPPAPQPPSLADAAQPQSFTVNVEITPIVFTNSGGDVASSGCALDSSSPALPTGLVVEPADDSGTMTCQITGTPGELVSPARTITVAATNAANTGSPDTATVSISVSPPPLQAPSLGDIAEQQVLTVDSMISPIIFPNGGGSVAPDGCALDSSSPALPTGLAVESVNHGGTVTCQITGTPSELVTPARTITVAAINGASAGTPDTATVSIVVNPPPPMLSDVAGEQALTVDVEIGPIVFDNAGGDVASGGCALDSSSPALPTGLVVEAADDNGTMTCQITGTPSELVTPARTITVAATNAANTGSPDTATVSISVSPPPLQPPSLADFTEARALTINIEMIPIVFDNSGGDVASGGCALDSSSPALPAGLIVESADDSGTMTCRITGTPGELVTPARTITVAATNAANTGSPDTATVAISVNPPPLEPPSLGDIAEQQVLTADSMISPIIFPNGGGSVAPDGCALDSSSPALPTGLAVESVNHGGTVTCQISGTPSELVTPARTITVAAINGASAGTPDTATVSIVVNPPPPMLSDVAGEQALTVDVEIDPIVFDNAGGDVASGGCAIDPSSPALPTGLVVEAADDSGTMTCQITGTPSELVAPARTITVAATNAANTGSPDTATVSIVVNPPPPMLSDVAGEQALTVDVEIGPIVFDNAGGDVAAGGCAIDPSSPALPTGLVVEAADDSGTMTCQISGTPSELVAPARTITVAATNAANTGSPDTATVSIVVNPPPPMLSDVAGEQALTVDVEIGPIVFDNAGGDVASGGCAIDPSSPALPTGLVVEAADDSGTMTCQITGTPSELVATARTITVAATNAANTGSPDTATVSIVVNPPPPMLSDVAGEQALTVDVEIGPIVFDNAGGDVAAGGCAIDPSSPALPTGLVVEAADDNGTMTCRISGTPSELVTPARTITVAATNAANTGSPDTATVSISVNPPPLQPPLLADFTEARALTINIEMIPIVFDNSGGDVAPDGCALDGASPALPTGLVVEAADDSGTMTCRITGTPSELVSPARTVTVAATNAANAGSPDTATVAISVNPPPLEPPSLGDVAEQQVLTADSMINPIIFPNGGGSVAPDGCKLDSSSAALPMGLVVESVNHGGTVTCQISGTPGELVSPARTVTVAATNAASVGDADTATVSIVVNPPPPMLSDIAGEQALTVDVEIGPIVFDNAGGDVAADGCALDPNSPALPTGLVVEAADDSGTMTCQISGTPSELVTTARTVTVAATNAANTGSPDTATVSIVVNPPPPMLSDVAGEQALTVDVEIGPIVFDNAGGDVAAGGCAIDPSSPALPTGLVVEAADDSGTMTCQISGTPGELVATARTVTVAATNAANTGSPDTATVSIVVNPPAPMLSDVAGEQVLTVDVEIGPIVFDNAGGDVATGGCAIDPSSPALPTGLAVESVSHGGTVTCQISGTPSELVATARTITVAATNAANTGSPDTATVSIVVNPPAPMLSDVAGEQALTVDVEIGPIVFDNAGGDVAAGGCAIDPSSPALPTGLAVESVSHGGTVTCQISGTPSELVATARTVTVAATNAANTGSPDTATVSIVVNPPAPALMDVAEAQALTVDIEATPIRFTNGGGDVASAGCMLVDGSPLPLGLQLRRFETGAGVGSCEIFGTPTAITSVMSYSITGTNAGGVSQATVQIAVNPAAPVLASIAEEQRLTRGVEISAITFPNSGGGVASEGCALAESSDALPMGLELGVSAAGGVDTCQITGIPTEQVLTARNVVVEATNVANPDSPATAMVALVVYPPAPALADIAEEEALTVDVQIEPIVFDNTGGDVASSGCALDGASAALPLGLVVEPVDDNGTMTCQISGTATELVDPARTIIIAATNIANSAMPDTASVAIAVNPAAPDLVSIVGAQTFTVNVEISPIQFTNNGGSVQASGCAVVGENPLPLGLAARTYTVGSLVSCEIHGTPTQASSFTVHTIRGSNGGGDSDAAVTIAVGQAVPSLADIADAQVVLAGTAITPIQFVNSGGDVDAQGCSGDLPLGLALRTYTQGAGKSCEIHGTPTGEAGSESHTITAMNDAGMATATVTITVQANQLSAALDSDFYFTPSGDAAWVSQSDDTSDGVDAGKSGAITHRQSSCISMPANTPGRLGFHWKVSSEATYDKLSFRIGGNLQEEISGLSEWVEYEHEHLPDSGGNEVFQWCYTKDVSQSSNDDAGYLDQVSFVISPVAVVTTLVSTTQIDLEWSEFTQASSYQVWRGGSSDPAAATRLSPSTEVTTNAYSDTAVIAGATYYYWITACDANGCTERSTVAIVTARVADGDANGLIDINTAAELSNLRYGLDGSSYSEYPRGVNNLGCPGGRCAGYELKADIDFDLDGDGSTWLANDDGSFTLDSGDDHDGHFDVETGGWMPIGDSDDAAFDTTFDGNGNTISGLAISSEQTYLGLFGALGSDAVVRGLRLVELLVNNARSDQVTAYSGGLAGYSRADIIDTYAAGRVEGSDSRNDYIGLLVGRMQQGVVVASHVAGRVGSSDGSDYIGGLAGYQNGGDIVASYADADVFSGDGSNDDAGGLVGSLNGGEIYASYALGQVDGGLGNSDRVGGLVGILLSGTISASYAMGDVFGGGGTGDLVGALIGFRQLGAVTSSWGFGIVHGGSNAGYDGSADLPSGVTAVNLLSSGNAPTIWDEGSGFSADAWDLGTAQQTPALAYADYDGSGTQFHCASDSVNQPSGALLIPSCTSEATLLPGQRMPSAPGQASIVAGTLGTVEISFGSVLNADSYIVLRNTSDDPDNADDLSAGIPISQGTYADSGLANDTTYYYWLRGCNADGCSAHSRAYIVEMRSVDADRDGLIEIASLSQLHNMRHNLAGDAYGASAGVAVSIGCPSGDCHGYELSNGLDFDTSNDGASWSEGDDGAIELDEGDDDELYFDTAAGGWLPIGESSEAPFNAVFDGNGFDISGLAVARDMPSIGLFAYLGSSAQVRNLGLLDAAVANTGSVVSATYAGALAGHSSADIAASYATGTIRGGSGGGDRVGALVGEQVDGAIVASFAHAEAVGGDGPADAVGGLVGRQGDGSIRACYAMGPVAGGDGNNDRVGALVGEQAGGYVGASFASGDVDGGGGGGDAAALLLGSVRESGLSDSWGFGESLGGELAGSDGSGSLPQGVTSATDLTSGNAPSSWNRAAERTAGAWDFGTANQTPALAYADYDGPTDNSGSIQSGGEFHCASDSVNAEGGAVLVAECSSMLSLLPNQRLPLVPLGIDVELRSALMVAITWDTTLNVSYYRVHRGTTNKLVDAAELTMDMTQTGTEYVDSVTTNGVSYYYWIQGCQGDGVCSGHSPAFTITPRMADSDGDGLIEINNLSELSNMRLNLDGDSYIESAGAAGNAFGCPLTGCNGYELMADLDFDSDGDDTTWSKSSEGAYLLDGDDDVDSYFDTDGSGWLPIGPSGSEAFDAIFEGNGNTVSNLASSHAAGVTGMFGYLSVDGEIRNFGLINNLAHYRGTSQTAVGGLVAVNRGSITTSYSTGEAASAVGSYLGGFVGRHVSGVITACYSTGDAVNGSGNSGVGGSLVGDVHAAATIRASYASGDAFGTSSNSERIGALVGLNSGGTILASYATGDADAGSGSGDVVGSLIGDHSSGTVTASWGFGNASNGDTSNPRSSGNPNDRPSGASSASLLTFSATPITTTDVPVSWNAAISATLNAWDFGDNTQDPALIYNDYDSSSGAFHCASDAVNAPDGSILIADCGDIIGDQRPETEAAPPPASFSAPVAYYSASTSIPLPTTDQNGQPISWFIISDESGAATLGTGVLHLYAQTTPATVIIASSHGQTLSFQAPVH